MKARNCAVFGSLVVSFAGMACLYLKDYNVFNAEMWIFGFKVVIHMPLELIENSTSGPDRMLFRGIAASLGGMFAAGFLIAVFATINLIEKAEGMRVFANRAIGRDSAGSVSPKQRRPFAPLFRSGMHGGLVRLCPKIAGAFGNATKMAAGGAAIAGTLPAMPLRLFKSCRSRISSYRQLKRENEENAGESASDPTFGEDLRQWHVAACGMPRRDADIIAGAGNLLARANHDAREQVMERDAIGGELMLRIMEDWAQHDLSVDECEEKRIPNASIKENGNDSRQGSGSVDAGSEDLSIPQVDEIGNSGELFVKWLALAKASGASGVNVARPLIVRDENGYRVTGIVHLVMEWVSGLRLNVILRHVPNGAWTMEKGNPGCNDVKMVNQSGGFVAVSREMATHPDIADGTTIVHFYGPGAFEGMQLETGGLIVMTSVPDVSIIRDLKGMSEALGDNVECGRQKNA
ncbi:MAG: hypothetical protein OXE85_06785 [Roseovarius sp.]|nr:hypothetical protein [Roseovarius sp.]